MFTFFGLNLNFITKQNTTFFIFSTDIKLPQIYCENLNVAITKIN